MSMERKEAITCPKCGKESEFTIWSSLNGDIDPEAKHTLMNGTLFAFECSHCGYKTNVCYPILYHDMAHSVMIYFVDEASVEQTKAMFSEIDEKPEMISAGYRRRIVTNQNSLREKAIIFDNELDDRVIEVIKLVFLANAQKQYKEANIKEVFFLISDGKYMLQFIGDQNLSAEFDRDLYDRIAKDYSARFPEDDSEFTVDLDYANRALRS